MISFEALANAILKFAESEIFPRMSTAQEIAARVAFAWLLDSGNIAVDLIAQNNWAKTFGLIDGKKNINAERALMYLYAIAQKKKLEISIPFFGNFAFLPEDIEKIRELLKEA